ncbi:MAG: T9SS type A sorting domain-containing protein [Bacteroidota bacterium]
MKLVPLVTLLLFFTSAYGQVINPGGLGGLYPELIWESRPLGVSTWYPAQACENAGSAFWLDFETELPMTREFRIRNIGEAPAVIRNITLTQGNLDFAISGEECDTEEPFIQGCLLLPGGSKTFLIHFDPQVVTHGSIEIIEFEYGRSNSCTYTFGSYCPPCRGFDEKDKVAYPLQLSDELRVYPTATNNILNVEFPSEAQATSFQIFDLNGRPLEALTIKPSGALYRLDVSNLTAGAYFIRDSYGRTKRFVKTN